MQKLLCKISSVCLSLALVLSLSVLPAASGLTASAAGSSFAPSAASGMISADNLTSWWSSNLEVTDLSDGGIHWKCQHSGVGMRQGWKQAYALDGLFINFSGLSNPNGAASLLIYLSSTTTGNLEPNVNTCRTDYGLIALDTINGQIRFENDGATDNGTNTRIRTAGTVLIQNDLLKYDALAGKDFTVSFSKGESGYSITVKVDGQTITGSEVLTNEMLGRLTKLNDLTTVYVGLGNNNGNSGWTEVDLKLIGTLNGPERPVINQIDELSQMSDEVLLYSGNVMRAARTAFEALDAETQALVTNIAVLTAVEEKYQRLADEADSYMVTMNTAHTRITNAANLMPDSYNSYISSVKKNLTVADLETGGIKLSIPNGSGVGPREYYNSNVNLNGVKLQFDNFVSNGGNYRAGQMAILFGNGEMTEPSIAGCFALVFNPESGTVYALPNEKGAYNQTACIDGYVVIQSDLLKGANLENRRFSIALASNSEIVTDENGKPHQGLDVTVEISGETLTGTVPYTGVLEKAAKIYYTDNVTVGLSLALPYTNGTTMGYSVEWLGVDSGVVNGKDGNFALDDANTVLEGGAVLDQGQISLPQDASVEFTVNTDKVDLRLMGYSGSSNVDVYVNGTKIYNQALATAKLLDKWFTVAQNLDSSVDTTVKLVNVGASLVTLDGVSIDLVGDINSDGSVNSTDLTVIRKYLLGIENSGIVLQYADLNNDGNVNIIDLVHLKKSLANSVTYINNAVLLPAYYTTLAKDVDANNVPNWTNDLIIGEVNLRTATEEGTIQAATMVLDHYAEMGVNGVWITPVFDGGASGNGYGNLGINTIDPSLTGTGKDYEAGWAVLKSFIDEAHSRNIRIILDVVFRGVQKDSPLYEAHQNWFTEDTQYGNYRFLWEDASVNSEIAAWYVENVVAIAQKTGCDGFRYDMMPATVSKCDVPVEKNIVDALHKAGCYLFIMSEAANKRSGLYATETVSINEALSYEYYKNPYDLFLGKYDIADFITSGSTALNAAGTYKYYTYSLANHDFKTTAVNGSRIAVGYQAIFSPFIPVIYLGEEWNNPYNSTNPYDSALYYNTIDWSALNLPQNRAFYEDIKAMIRIRRTYSDLFNIDAAQFKDSNICRLTTSGAGVSAYARFAGNRAALIIPNNTETTANVNIAISLADIGLSEYNSFTVADAETGAVIASGTASDIENLTVAVNTKDQRVLIITGR